VGELLIFSTHFVLNIITFDDMFRSLFKAGINWTDILPDCRPVVVRGICRASFPGNLLELTCLMKTVELIRLPWKENNDLVEYFFIALARVLSKENQLQVLQRNKWKDEEKKVYQLLDFCVSQIDHSMLSHIITE
jgi:hypothetical protein